jgi:heptosyltransferase-2
MFTIRWQDCTRGRAPCAPRPDPEQDTTRFDYSMLNPIWVRLPNWVGDACMALPALDLLRTAGQPLVLVGRPWARDLLAGLEPRGFVALGGPLRADLATLRTWLRDARARTAIPVAPQRGITFPDSISSALLFRLAGIRAAGYRDEGRSLLLKWPVSKPRHNLHVVESYYYLARCALQRWGITDLPEVPGPKLVLPLTSGHHQAARTMLSHVGLNRPFVLLSPTATGLHKGRIKYWPFYGALAKRLQAAGWATAICPPPGEVDAAHAAAPTAQILPALPLGAYAVLTQCASLVICNDSGTSHVAAAAGARQITLFGVTRPARTGPWSPTAVHLGNENRWPTLEEVADLALQLLGESAHAPVAQTPAPGFHRPAR